MAVKSPTIPFESNKILLHFLSHYMPAYSLCEHVLRTNNPSTAIRADFVKRNEARTHFLHTLYFEQLSLTINELHFIS